MLQRGGDARLLELALTPGDEAAAKASTAQFSLRLLSVEPYPRAGRRMPREDYRAVLVVTPID